MRNKLLLSNHHAETQRREKIRSPYKLLQNLGVLASWREKFQASFTLLTIAFSVSAWSQEINFDVSFSVDWAKAELHAQTSFSLAEAGIRLPAGRFLAEETLREAYPSLIKPHLASLQADSASTIASLLERRELIEEDLDALCRETGNVPPSLTTDLARMTGRYTIPLGKLSALILKRKNAIEPEKPLVPVKTADYTGIIIIADDKLPVHGRRAEALLEPCLFPKIWDTGMNLVYDRNIHASGNLMVQYAGRSSIFRSSPSGLEGELAALLGNNPLRIIARGVFGINPTDPVIDREDALKILSTENNRRLLREGRVLFVLNEGMLKSGN